jgi:hypothetical protein
MGLVVASRFDVGGAIRAENQNALFGKWRAT